MIEHGVHALPATVQQHPNIAFGQIKGTSDFGVIQAAQLTHHHHALLVVGQLMQMLVDAFVQFGFGQQFFRGVVVPLAGWRVPRTLFIETRADWGALIMPPAVERHLAAGLASLMAMRASQVRSFERPSNFLMAEKALIQVSWATSSASSWPTNGVAIAIKKA
jgi:hypothetical protein